MLASKASERPEWGKEGRIMGRVGTRIDIGSNQHRWSWRAVLCKPPDHQMLASKAFGPPEGGSKMMIFDGDFWASQGGRRGSHRGSELHMNC